MRAWIMPAASIMLLHVAPALGRDWHVRSAAEFAQATSQLKAGDTVVLANGEWRDFDAVFKGVGAPDRPITLAAERPGGVVLTGRSRLRLAGSHLVVSNLVFRNGHTPGDEVVSFRTDSRHWAEHSRLTGIVIDRFNNPDRRAEDHWVAIYGSDNRVDHSHFEGKQNAGAMMVVVRQKGMPLENRARIDHNYFGPRPPLGSNGGETIRIGTSTESGSDSRTVVEDNLFERCDGEVEIVSVKSGGNVVRRNLFLDSQGSVVLRHGNGNIVEDNVFLGHGIPHTGGIRVINERQVVRNNYLEGVAGIDFTSALAVMNGVPNSPVNRYMPVRHAVIEQNSFLNVAQIAIGAGADAERAQPPRDTRIAGNLMTGVANRGVLRFESDAGGVTFDGNVLGSADAARDGVAVRPVTLKRAANGLLYPVGHELANVGASRGLKMMTRQEVGVSWYAQPVGHPVVFQSGSVMRVNAAGSLERPLKIAPAGTVIELARGTYRVTTPLVIDRPVTLRAAPTGAATLKMEAATLFQLEEGGALELDGLVIVGSAAPRVANNAVIRTASRAMLGNYRLRIAGTRMRHLDGAPGFDVVASTPATLAGQIEVADSEFDRVSGAVLALAAEKGREGWYAAEDVRIARSRFSRVGTVVNLLRAGNDESTFGPRFAMTGSIVTDSGPLRLSGLQEASITGNRFINSGGIEATHSVGSPHTRISGNGFDGTPAPVVRELTYKGAPRALIVDNQRVQ